MKSSKLTTETIQPLTEMELAPDRAMQTVDSKGPGKGTISLMSQETVI